ncbi:MAG: alpha-L-fucosidase [Acidimicrobiales bacterium]
MTARATRLQALRRRPVPAWWLDAKLGIFVHWTMASVPAYAPVGDDIGTLIASPKRQAFAWSPYVEWYENSIRFADSPAARHHRATYGDRSYQTFREPFEAGIDQWDPEVWAARFAATGARYVVMVAKHHDGYCLWPTGVDNPERPGWHSRRDVLGELAEAVRGAGMRFGLYYSGGLDWTFDDRPLGSMADVLAAVPRGSYPAYADAQVRELIDRYRPSVLWNDIAWPATRGPLWGLFGHYYDSVPDGVVNDRWMPWNPLLATVRSEPVRRMVDAGIGKLMTTEGGMVPPRPPHFDVRTPEYVTFDDVQPDPWECVRGIDRSFGYNAASRPADFLGHDELLWLLVDIAAKGGNLLLNVGPRGSDGSIPDEQADRLGWLGEWVGPHRRALMDTRPWVHAGTVTAEGRPVRYTARGDTVFALVRNVGGTTDPGDGSPPDEPVTRGRPATPPGGTSVILTDVRATPTSTVTTLSGRSLAWEVAPTGLSVELPGPPSEAEPSVVVLDQVEAG